MTNFFIGPFLEWVPSVVWVAVIFYAAFRYVTERGGEKPANNFFLRFSYRQLALAVIVFHLVYAFFSTVGQYWVWRASAFTQSFLQFPLDSVVISPLADFFAGIFKSKLGYFLFYSWGHFWAFAFLSIAMAWVFRVYLRWLEKRNSRFFYEGEVQLGFLCALVVGWPKIILFIPVLFLSVLTVSLYKIFSSKESYTTLGYPFLLGVVLTALLWDPLSSVFFLAQWNP
ncbi:MAG: hypothetical protein AAB631_01470 [Patescibacteria group bacterium]